MAAQRQQPRESYWTQLQESCYPVSVPHFRFLKSVFYTLLVAGILVFTLRESALDPNLGFGLFVFALIVIVTELKEIEVGASIGRVTATFNGSHDSEDDED